MRLGSLSADRASPLLQARSGEGSNGNRDLARCATVVIDTGGGSCAQDASHASAGPDKPFAAEIRAGPHSRSAAEPHSRPRCPQSPPAFGLTGRSRLGAGRGLSNFGSGHIRPIRAVHASGRSIRPPPWKPHIRRAALRAAPFAPSMAAPSMRPAGVIRTSGLRRRPRTSRSRNRPRGRTGSGRW